MHDRQLLCQAQPARVGGGVEGGQVGEDPPRDGEVPPLVLEAPDVARQTGVDPLLGVIEAGLMVAVPDLPGGGR